MWGVLTTLCINGITSAKPIRPFLTVGINELDIKALFDTGATISVINWRTFLRLRNRPQLTPMNLSVSAANGHRLKVRGSAMLKLTIHGKPIIRPFAVVENLNTDVIVGADTMDAEHIIIDVHDRTIYRKPKNTSEKISSLQLASTKGTIVMQPLEEQLIKLVPDIQIPKNTDILVNANGDLNPLYQISPSLVHSDPDGTIRVVVTNPTDQTQTFQPQQISAEFEIIDQRTQQVFNIDSVQQNFQHKTKPTISEKDVNLQQIPKEFQPKYLQLLNQFADILSINVNEVGKADVIKQTITLKDPNKIASTPPYRLPVHLKEVAVEYVRTLLDAGIIRKSTSPFCSPLLLVKKPHAAPDAPLVSQYRVCHDFRRLNALQIKDSYPLHNLYDLLDSVAKAKVWTVIDLSNGFFNQLLEDESKKYTAFGIPGVGHWEYNRSAQGLCNSAAAFQRLLDYVIRGLPDTYVYIDDCIICADTHEQMLEKMKNLFLRFRKYALKCRVSKLQIGAAEINYLGYNLTQKHGIRPGAAKIEALKRWNPPKDITQLRAFLGLTSFFRRTVNNFAQIAQPLTQLTRQDAKFKGDLTPEALAAFNKLKQILSTRPTLKPTDFTKEFIVTCDASDKGLGAILSQIHDNGIEYPCAYASRALSPSEQKWAPFHKEHAGMLFACKQFKPYLVGRHFTIRTDHKPLLTLNNVQANCVDRIKAQMDEFQPFTVKYIKGAEMPADGFSRYCFAITDTPGSDLSTEQLFHLQNQCNQTKAIACKLKYNVLPQNRQLKTIVHSWTPHAKITDSLVKIKHNDEWKIFAPSRIRHTLIQLAHDSPTAGHFGPSKTLANLQRNWIWPRMAKEIETHCFKCHQCSTNNPSKKIAPQPLRTMPVARHFNDIIQTDLIGPLPSINGQKYLMVIIDRYSRLMTLATMPDKTAESAADALMTKFFAKHGTCNTLISDRGSEYVNNIFKELATKFNFTHNFASSGHPMSNGLTERLNKTIIQYLRKFLEGKNDWVSLLPPLELAYNTTKHTSTQAPPYAAAFNRFPKTPYTPSLRPNYSENKWSQDITNFSRIQKLVTQNLQKSEETQKIQFDKRAKERQFQPGDLVLVTRPHSGQQFQKFQPNFMGPYRVAKLLENDNIGLIRLSDNKLFTVHKNRILMAKFQDNLATPIHPTPNSDNNTQIPQPMTFDTPEDDTPPQPPQQPPQPPQQQQQPVNPFPPHLQAIPNAQPVDAGGHAVRLTPDREQKRVEQLKKEAARKRTRDTQNLVEQDERWFQTEAEYQAALARSKAVFKQKFPLTRQQAQEKGIEPAIVLNPPSSSSSSSEADQQPPEIDPEIDPLLNPENPQQIDPAIVTDSDVPEDPNPYLSPQPGPSGAHRYHDTDEGYVPRGPQLPRTPQN